MNRQLKHLIPVSEKNFNHKISYEEFYKRLPDLMKDLLICIPKGDFSLFETIQLHDNIENIRLETEDSNLNHELWYSNYRSLSKIILNYCDYDDNQRYIAAFRHDKIVMVKDYDNDYLDVESHIDEIYDEWKYVCLEIVNQIKKEKELELENIKNQKFFLNISDDKKFEIINKQDD